MSCFADAARRMWGEWAGYLVALGAMVSCYGALNGWIMLQGQVPWAAARDGLFPARFARKGPRGTPVFGLVVSSVLVTALMAANYTRSLVDLFTFILLLSTLTALVPYAFVTLSELLIGRPTRRTVVLASLAFLYALWAIAGAGMDIVYWGFLLLMAGTPVYVWLRRRSPTAVVAGRGTAGEGEAGEDAGIQP